MQDGPIPSDAIHCKLGDFSFGFSSGALQNTDINNKEENIARKILLLWSQTSTKTIYTDPVPFF